MYTLYIANKNYSSWSLRVWVLMRELGLPFKEELLVFGDAASWDHYRKISPAGRVPCLLDAEEVVWDSLAIAEYLAEHHQAVWPRDAKARAWARSAAAEMHSGFAELRQVCSMNLGVRVRLGQLSDALRGDIARLGALWNEGLKRFGGPFLAGAAFSAADAFYAPVAFRIQTYGVELDQASAAYARRLLQLKSMGEWYASALAETWRDAPHDALLLQFGAMVEDLRAT